METLHPKARRDPYGSKINRTHSSLLAFGVPWLSILLGSLTPWLPVIAPAPLLPPFGFMLMLAWRMLRPGLLPLWAGLPLGLFDDFYSGQPLGSGVLLFSLLMGALVTRIGYTPFFIGLAALDLIGAAVLWTLVRERRPDAVAAAA